MQSGLKYYEDAWKKNGKWCRVIYLEDDDKKFIPKEKLKKKKLIQECEYFFNIAEKLKISFDDIYFINSHYWDGGLLGCLIRREIKNKYKKIIPHFWTPHSLGMLKRDNYKKTSKSVVRVLNIPSRINKESEIIKEVDGVVCTSKKIEEYVYKYKAKPNQVLWFPSGVETKLFKTRKLSKCGKAIKFLAKKMILTNLVVDQKK